HVTSIGAKPITRWLLDAPLSRGMTPSDALVLDGALFSNSHPRRPYAPASFLRLCMRQHFWACLPSGIYDRLSTATAFSSCQMQRHANMLTRRTVLAASAVAAIGA